MALGLSLFAGTLALQAAAAFGGCGGLVARWRQGSRLWVPTFRAFLAVLVSAHALGIFSFFYLLSEGGMWLRGAALLLISEPVVAAVVRWV